MSPSSPDAPSAAGPVGIGELSPADSRASTGEETVVLFDGHCNLCSGAVQRLIRLDRNRALTFGSLQSERGRHLRERFGVPPSADTIVVIHDGKAATYSDAVLTIGAALGGKYRLASRCGRAVPRPVRDLVYRFVARNRFRWFGRPTQCWLPTPDLATRFIAGGQGVTGGPLPTTGGARG